MPGKSVRSNAKRSQHSAGTETDSAESRLGNFGGLQVCAVLISGRLVKSRSWIDEFDQTALPAAAICPKGPVRRGEGVKELRKPGGQILEHPRILGSLTGEKHCQLAVEMSLGKKAAVGSTPGIPVAALEHGQRAFDLDGRFGGIFLKDHQQTAGLFCIKAVTAFGGSQAQGVPRRINREVFQACFQSALISGTEGRYLDIALPVGRSFEWLVFFEQTVKIAAAETERADPGPAGMITTGNPGPGLGVDVEGGTFCSHRLLRFVNLDGRRQGFVVKRHGRLDQSGRAGSGLGVADLGFDRADRTPGRIGLAKDVFQGRHFNGIADLGAGTMSLNQLDGLRVNPALRVGSAQGLLLTSGARFVNRRAAAVARSTNALDNRVDLVSITFGVGETLDDDNPQAFAKGGAVSVISKRPGVSGR